ncbi:MAG: cofactor-independent phosphoglycerate mutase [Coriobacteriia bacterium]|nr:cofactor-independent phosphoglycerate mutase [Coriobacteriia bacterium]
MKYVIVILDGAAGHALAELGEQTSLESAGIPILDSMAREGIVGLAKTVPDSCEPSSSAACTSILGYDPLEDYIGRAAIEAAAAGITLSDDEIAMRINTVTLENSMMKSYACGHVTTAESAAMVHRLAAELNDDTFTFYPGVGYRHILVIKSHPELLELEYTPPHDISDKSIEGHLPRGNGAELLLDLMERAHEILAIDSTNEERIAAGKFPCTDIWPFWPGAAPRKMLQFEEKFGVSVALSSGVDLLFGLAEIFGLDRLLIEGVTDGPDNDYAKQAYKSLSALDEHDLVVIHIEAPDEMGHAGDAAGKVKALENIDRKVMSRILGYAINSGDVRVLAMPDHPTPVELKTHVNEPVPFIVWGAGIDSNGAFAYSERAAQATGLVLDPGKQVMDMLLGR